MEVALQRVRLSAQLGTTNKKVSFTEFLKLLGVVDDGRDQQSIEHGREKRPSDDATFDVRQSLRSELSSPAQAAMP